MPARRRPWGSLLIACAALASPAPASAALPDHAPRVTLEGFNGDGFAPGQQFGYVVAGAGDFNADGFADWIVTAPVDDGGGLDVGAAYVFFGGPTLDLVPDLVLRGEAVGDKFGESAAALGDFNADGFDDLIVGADGHDANGGNSGRAYVYFGGPAADSVADLRFTGEAPADYFAFSCASAGDLNADGWPDAVVGAPLNDRGGSNAGAAFVYFGGPGADEVPDLVLSGFGANDEFGRGLAGVGDFNGDGSDDLAVGAPYNDVRAAEAGAVLIYFGGAGVDSLPERILLGEAAGDFFGWPIAGVGDFDGDGFADLAVAAPGNDAGGPDAGAVGLYGGGVVSSPVPILTLRGEAEGDRFGSGLAGGDVNRDGRGDVLVGAPWSDASSTDGGRAQVYYGGSPPDTVADEALPATGLRFGNAIALAGDLLGDGFPDLVVGAYHTDAGAPLTGRVFAYDVDRYTVALGACEGRPCVSWAGAEPADVLLSLDGGDRWERVAGNVGGTRRNVFDLPRRPASARARVRVVPSDPLVSGSATTGEFVLRFEQLNGRVQVWPSPARRGEAVQVSLPVSEIGGLDRVEVIDLGGRIVAQYRPGGVVGSISQFRIDAGADGLEPGVYFLRARFVDGVALNARFVILD